MHDMDSKVNHQEKMKRDNEKIHSSDIPQKRKKEDEDEKKNKKSHISYNNIEIEERLINSVLGDGMHLVEKLFDAGDTDSEGGMSEEEENHRQPAWKDLEDESVTVKDVMESSQYKSLGLEDTENYEDILRARFQSATTTPSWAVLKSSRTKNQRKSSSDDEEENAEDEIELLQRRAGKSLLKVGSRGGKLEGGALDIKRLASLNSDSSRAEGRIVTSVQFHPKSTVALVAGSSGVTSIFQVDGKGNNKLASVKFEEFPVSCAKFGKGGEEVVIGSSRCSLFYSYDLMEGRTLRLPLPYNMNMKKFEISPDGRTIAVCGKSGEVFVLNGSSKEIMYTLMMNSTAKDLAFSPDSNILYAHGEGGELWAWSLDSQRCIGRLMDEGSIGGTALAVGGQLLATGCASGIVSIYERSQVSTALNSSARGSIKPLKRFMNLVTPATRLRFDPSGQILAMASYHKQNSVKLVHIGSMTVFSNFPSLNSVLYKVQNFDFSPMSGYFSLTNNKSTAFLYRLSHFGNY